MGLGAAGQAALGGAFGIGGQMLANRGNQKLAEQQAQWNLEQWNRQNTRDDQLWDKQNAYNLEMWHMQNKYNSPQEQMARFKEAGLNPHLIYGKGTPGNAQAMQSNKQSAPGITPYNRPQMESITKGLDVFGQFQNLKNTQAQTNNLEAQNDVISAEASLKRMQTILTALNASKGKFDYDVAKELRETSVEAAKQNLLKTKSEISRNFKDIDLKKLQIDREENNVFPGDHPLIRILQNPEMLQTFLSGIKQFAGSEKGSLIEESIREAMRLLGLTGKGLAKGFKPLVSGWDK